jgi:signal transduction histidine kinase
MTKPDTYRIDEAEVTQTATAHGGGAVFNAPVRHLAGDTIVSPSSVSSSSVSSISHTKGARARRPDMDDDALLAVRLEALAEFAAGAGHEINNPLAAISGRAQMLLKTETDPERRRHLLTIGAQALRIRDMIGDVMLFARPPIPEPQPVNLKQRLDEVLMAFSDDLAESQLIVEQSHDCDTFVHADETQLNVVLSELLRNAIRFSPADSTIRIETKNQTPEFSTIVIFDDGPGLSEMDREHLFDPFYSGRQAGRGLGFGLSKCWRIVTLHGGRMRPIDGTGFGIEVDWPTATFTHPPDPTRDR